MFYLANTAIMRAFYRLTILQPLNTAGKASLEGRIFSYDILARSLEMATRPGYGKTIGLRRLRALVSLDLLKNKIVILFIVADLISRGTHSWNHESLFPTVAHLIYRIQLSSLDVEDTYCWPLTKSGDYSVRTGYYAQVQYTAPARPPYIPANSFSWKKHVWDVNTSPKLKLFLWKLCCGALTLGYNILTRGVTSAPTCPHCTLPETSLHLFFMCAYAQQVWSRLPCKDYTGLHAMYYASSGRCSGPYVYLLTTNRYHKRPFILGMLEHLAGP